MTTSDHNTSADESPRTERSRTSPILERNIRALAELAQEQQKPKSGGDRIAMAVSRFAGTMSFVYFHAVVYGLWAAMDRGWIPIGLPARPLPTTIVACGPVDGGWRCAGTGCLDGGLVCMHDAAAPQPDPAADATGATADTAARGDGGSPPRAPADRLVLPPWQGLIRAASTASPGR
jgi:hypothetical protein